MPAPAIITPVLEDMIHGDAGDAFLACGPSQKVLSIVTGLARTRIHQVARQADRTGAPQHLGRMIYRLAKGKKTSPFPLLAWAHGVAEEGLAQKLEDDPKTEFVAYAASCAEKGGFALGSLIRFLGHDSREHLQIFLERAQPVAGDGLHLLATARIWEATMGQEDA